MGDSITNLFSSRPRRYIFDPQKIFELFPSCKAAQIQKKSYYHLGGDEIACITPPIYNLKALDSLR